MEKAQGDSPGKVLAQDGGTDHQESGPAFARPSAFARHVLEGMLMFLLPAFAAGGLNVLVHYAADWHIDQPILIVITAGEYLLLALDCWLFLGWFVETAIEGTKDFWGWFPRLTRGDHGKH